MANSFPLGQTRTVHELADSCGLNEGDARRILRHAVTNRLFQELPDGSLAHTAASKTIVEVPYFKDWIDETCTNMWASAPRVIDAITKWPGSEEPNETAFNLAWNTTLPFFPEISKRPEAAKRFADAMSFFQAGPGMETAITIGNFDWTKYASGKIVDVGGSHGAIALELASRFPSMECVVQDLPEVIKEAKLPEDRDLARRVTFQAHDFFTEQSVKDADVFFLRMILHNWGDKYAIKILRNLIPALKPGARIVINDHVVPEPGILSHFQERSVRGFDWVMKEMFNAKERDINDWTRLLGDADPRFRFQQVIQPPGSQLQLLEVSWE